MTDTPAPADERWVVILVHGVGETEPSDMIAAVAPVITAVQDPTRQPSDEFHEARLPDEGRKTFPVFTRRDRVGAAEVLYAEVFWADLSRIRKGLIPLLWGVYNLIFSVRYIADQASDQPSALAAFLRMRLKNAAFLLRGPMFALYMVATVYSLVCVGAEWLRYFGWPIDMHAAPAAPAVFGVVGLAAVVVGLAAAGRTRGSLFFTAPPWMSLAVVGALAVVVSLLVLTQPDGVVSQFLYQPVHSEYAIVQDVGQAEFYPALAELAADYVLWIIAIFLLMALLPLAIAWLAGRKDLRQALAGAYLAGVLQTLLWVLVASVLDLIIMGAVTMRQTNKDAAPYWNDRYEYFTFQIAGIVLLTIVAAVVLIRRVVWSGRHKPSGWPLQQVPRLIVAAAVACCLLAISFLFFIFLVIIPFYQHFEWPLPNAWAVFAVWFVLIGGIAAVHLVPGPLRNVMHVVMDVINHFRTKGSRFVVRERINHRFQSVLQYAVAQGKPVRLLVIAHSQGTVIALNSLQLPACQAALQQAGLRAENCQLATFGSPYTHLYQFYFPTQYPPLPGGAILGAAFGRWVNLFRIDDYVGTQINGQKDVDRPTNMPLPAGYIKAHTDYWRTDVFALIQDLLPGAPPGPSP
ncbi:MAG TPA: hypothetical protein VMS17_17205 [Gemmataceae bacterium]|nr:hypothetical protein [Gemmataceae bacterium]